MEKKVVEIIVLQTGIMEDSEFSRRYTKTQDQKHLEESFLYSKIDFDDFKTSYETVVVIICYSNSFRQDNR